jgi:putative sterol carrier protein
MSEPNHLEIHMTNPSDIAKVPVIFEHLAAEGQVAALRDRSGVFEFDISDGGGKWFVNLDHGTPKLAQSTDHPDVVIECDASDFVAMTEGAQNLMTGFLQGRVKLTGDLAFALDFRHLVPVPA